MKIFDFGKNTYQYSINFKFDCLSHELLRGLVQDFLFKRKYFSNVSKDQSANQTVLTKGEGTHESPLFQLKIGADTIILWAGWHVSYEEWQQWRTLLLSDIGAILQTIPIELVGALAAQFVLIVPTDKLKRTDEINELKPILAFNRRFIPEELLGRGKAYAAFGDKEGRQMVEWWVGGSAIPGEENVSFMVSQNALDLKSNLRQNMQTHVTASEKLVERFHSGFLSLLIKS